MAGGDGGVGEDGEDAEIGAKGEVGWGRGVGRWGHVGGVCEREVF